LCRNGNALRDRRRAAFSDAGLAEVND
jgi:hypothetical protein